MSANICLVKRWKKHAKVSMPPKKIGPDRMALEDEFEFRSLREKRNILSRSAANDLLLLILQNLTFSFSISFPP